MRCDYKRLSVSEKLRFFISYLSLIAMAVFSPLFLSQPSLNTPKMTVKSLAVLNKSYKMRVPYKMKKEQTRLFRQLPSGLNMEVIEQKGLVFADKKIIETQEAVKTHLWFLFMEVIICSVLGWALVAFLFMVRLWLLFC